MVSDLGVKDSKLKRLLFNYLTKLSFNEKVLIKLIVSELKQESPVTEVSVLDYAIEIGVELEGGIDSIETTASNLFYRYLKAPFFDTDESYTVTSRWLDFYSSISDEDEPVIKIKLSDVLKGVVVCIGKDEVFAMLEELTSEPISLLNNPYAISLYSYLLEKGFTKDNSIEIELDKLRGVLDIGADKYKTIQNFKLRVLHPVIDDLNQQVGMSVKYSDVRNIEGSSRITGFIFSKEK